MLICLFFVKQKTAYDMRISYWSSNVCSYDLAVPASVLPIGGGGERSFSIPRQIEFTRAARPRYGLTSAPGRLSSRRVPSLCSGKMTRTAADRLSMPQDAFTGAKNPGTRRLYEFIVGLQSNDIAGRRSEENKAENKSLKSN